MDYSAFIQSLRHNFAPKQVLTNDHDLTNYTRDYRNFYDNSALGVCFPRSVEEVVHIVQVCRQYNVAIVPQGGNTSYAGGANPIADYPQIIVSLTQMNKVLDIDPVNRSILVEVGITLEALQQAALEAGLYFPLDLGARSSAQVGGLISTNAGGINVVKYGNMRDLILGLEVVNANAEVLDNLAPLRKNNTGYNLSQLHAGAEGTLGIITKAELKLVNAPKHRISAVLAFNTFDNVISAFQTIGKNGNDALHSFEYISQQSVKLTNESGVCPQLAVEPTAPHYVLLELTGGEFDAFQDWATELLANTMEESDAVDGIVAQSSQQSAALWHFRESIAHAERHFGGSIKFDVSVPISNMGEFIREGLATVTDVVGDNRPSFYGHVGDGNIHFNVLAPSSVDFTGFRAQWEEPLSRALFDLVAKLNGSFSAEHGIGQLKRHDVLRYKDSATIATYRSIKKALDGDNRFNPGKLIP